MESKDSNDLRGGVLLRRQKVPKPSPLSFGVGGRRGGEVREIFSLYIDFACFLRWWECLWQRKKGGLRKQKDMESRGVKTWRFFFMVGMP